MWLQAVWSSRSGLCSVVDELLVEQDTVLDDQATPAVEEATIPG